MNVKLDRRITIKSKSLVKESVHGSQTVTRAVVAVVWAERRDALPSRSEALRGVLEQGRNQVRYRMRYRDDVDSSMEIWDDGEALQIVGGPAELGRRQYLEVMCEAIKPGVA